MKLIKVCVVLAGLSLTSLLQGCSSALHVADPTGEALAEAPRLNMQVAVREIKDERKAGPDEFYREPGDIYGMGLGRYDRTVPEIVRAALIADCTAVGMTVADSTSPGGPKRLDLQCGIESFGLVFRTGDSGENFVDGAVTLSFKWFDPATNALVSVKQRTETCTVLRSKIVCDRTAFNPYNGEDNDNLVKIGNRLVQELLPKVIDKELTEDEQLTKFASPTLQK